MLMSDEPLRDRLRRRMRERKAANQAAAKKPRRVRPRSRKSPEAVDQDTIREELEAIDRHQCALEAQLGGPASAPHLVVGIGANPRTSRDRELRAEVSRLGLLKREIAADAEKPITANRNGELLTDRERSFRRMRTAELRDQYWHAAERAEREGDHRRARQLRHDALRSRHIAEYEMHLRPSLRGYSYPG